jgi:hypothetical protein
MSAAGKSWSFEKIAPIRAALRTRSASEVAAELGCSVANLRRRLASADNTTGERVYALRSAGAEFSDIAVELGLAPGPATTRRLYMRLVRYCERAGVEYPRPARRDEVEPTPSCEEANLDRIIRLIATRAARLEATDNWCIANKLQLSLKEVKCSIAELRRRRVIAAGIVPTATGLEEAARHARSKLAVHRVLWAIAESWAEGSDESLTSLCDKLPLARSTINLSIVRLRDDGYLMRRGHLALRNAR